MKFTDSIKEAAEKWGTVTEIVERAGLDHEEDYHDVLRYVRLLSRHDDGFECQHCDGMPHYRAISSAGDVIGTVVDPWAGQDKKSAAHAKMKDRYAWELMILHTFADRWIARHGECNTDILRNQFKAIDRRVIPQFWGNVFGGKKYKRVRWINSAIRSNHHRLIGSWTLA